MHKKSDNVCFSFFMVSFHNQFDFSLCTWFYDQSERMVMIWMVDWRMEGKWMRMMAYEWYDMLWNVVVHHTYQTSIKLKSLYMFCLYYTFTLNSIARWKRTMEHDVGWLKDEDEIIGERNKFENNMHWNPESNQGWRELTNGKELLN